MEDCQNSKVKVWLSRGLGWVEGHYCGEGTHQGEAKFSGYVEDQRCVAAQNVMDGTN